MCVNVPDHDEGFESEPKFKLVALTQILCMIDVFVKKDKFLKDKLAK